MRASWSRLGSILTAGVILVGTIEACNGDGTVAPPPIENPGTIRVTNATAGKIIFLFFRDCGSTNWGDDRLPEDPVTGVIEVTESKDFVVEEGCYDLRADHLDGEPLAPLVSKTDLNQILVEGSTLVWVVGGTPAGQE